MTDHPRTIVEKKETNKEEQIKHTFAYQLSQMEFMTKIVKKMSFKHSTASLPLQSQELLE
jgi:hypothetical protein